MNVIRQFFVFIGSLLHPSDTPKKVPNSHYESFAEIDDSGFYGTMLSFVKDLSPCEKNGRLYTFDLGKFRPIIKNTLVTQVFVDGRYVADITPSSTHEINVEKKGDPLFYPTGGHIDHHSCKISLLFNEPGDYKVTITESHEYDRDLHLTADNF